MVALCKLHHRLMMYYIMCYSSPILREETTWWVNFCLSHIISMYFGAISQNDCVNPDGLQLYLIRIKWRSRSASTTSPYSPRLLTPVWGCWWQACLCRRRDNPLGGIPRANSGIPSAPPSAKDEPASSSLWNCCDAYWPQLSLHERRTCVHSVRVSQSCSQRLNSL